MFFLFILCFMIHETTLNFPVPTMRATKIEKQKRKLSSSDKTTLTKSSWPCVGLEPTQAEQLARPVPKITMYSAITAQC